MKQNWARNLLIFFVLIFHLLLLMVVRETDVVEVLFYGTIAAMFAADAVLSFIQLRIIKGADPGTFPEFGRRYLLYLAEKVLIVLIDYALITALPLPSREEGVAVLGEALEVMAYLLICAGTMFFSAVMCFVIGAVKSSKK